MIATADDTSPGDKAAAKHKTVLKVPSRRVARTCHEPSCNKNPYFGWPGQKALYCVTHKEPGACDVCGVVIELVSPKSRVLHLGERLSAPTG